MCRESERHRDERVHENRRIKDRQKEEKNETDKERRSFYTDLFGLVIADDDDSEEDLLVSNDERCWRTNRASAALGVKYGEYQSEWCGLPTPLPAWWCCNNRWTAAMLLCCSRNSRLTAVCRFHLVLGKKREKDRWTDRLRRPVHAYRRFWYHVFTWVSERFRRAASSIRSCTLRYFCRSKLFSKQFNCWSVNAVRALRGFLLLFSVLPLIPWPPLSDVLFSSPMSESSERRRLRIDEIYFHWSAMTIGWKWFDSFQLVSARTVILLTWRTSYIIHRC